MVNVRAGQQLRVIDLALLYQLSDRAVLIFLFLFSFYIKPGSSVGHSNCLWQLPCPHKLRCTDLVVQPLQYIFFSINVPEL